MIFPLPIFIKETKETTKIVQPVEHECPVNSSSMCEHQIKGVPYRSKRQILEDQAADIKRLVDLMEKASV